MENWDAARSELEAAVAILLNCSTTLRDAEFGSVSFNQHSFASMGVAAQADQQLNSILQVQKHMETSGRFLNKILNTSAARVPMSRLPDELISQIFQTTIAATGCPLQIKTRDPLSVILLVSVTWHRIALDTPSLWSHVDVEYSSYAKDHSGWLTKIGNKLERCRGGQIHLHLTSDFRFCIPPIDCRGVSGLAALLRPYTFSLLSVSADDLTQHEVLQEVLSLSTPDGARIQLRRLWIEGCDSGSPNYISWPTSLGSNLVDLAMNEVYDDGAPTIKELLEMLASATSLRFLRLERSDFDYKGATNLPKVYLPDLRLLTLYLDRGRLSTLVSSLYPGESPIDIRLHICTYPHSNLSDKMVWSSFQALFLRCNVISLALPVLELGRNFLLTNCLTVTPRVRALFFSVDAHTIGSTLRVLLPWIQGDPSSRLVHLRVLGFNAGQAGHSVLRLIEELLMIRNLRHICFVLTSLSLSKDESNVESWLWGSAKYELLDEFDCVQVFDDDPADICHGQDRFNQALIRDV